MTTQDFVKGIDFTGLPSISGGDLNNLVDLANTSDNHGLVLINKDNIADTPAEVPNASVTIKWKKYLWIRIPALGVEDQTPKIYAWNENVASDALMLKWVEITVDIATAEASAAAAVITANSASDVANAANIAASNATIIANSALEAIDAANDKADNAVSKSEEAATTAATANDTAKTAKDTAEEAKTLAAAKRDITAAINPGTANQLIRTNNASTPAIEWFSPVNLFAKLSERQDKNTPGGSASLGINKRALNTEDYDTGNLVSVAAGGDVTIANAGIYHIKAWAVGWLAAAFSHQLVLADDSDAVLMLGSSGYSNTNGHNSRSEVEGVFSFAANDIIRLNHYFSAALANTAALGKPANVCDKEIYAEMFIQKLS